jgi:hypothetical protein
VVGDVPDPLLREHLLAALLAAVVTVERVGLGFLVVGAVIDVAAVVAGELELRLDARLVLDELERAAARVEQVEARVLFAFAVALDDQRRAVGRDRRVWSWPPVSWTGKRIGPSSRQICDTPVTRQLKKSAPPSGARTPEPGARTSSIAWMPRARSSGSGLGAYLSRISFETLAAPWPEYVAAAAGLAPCSGLAWGLFGCAAQAAAQIAHRRRVFMDRLPIIIGARLRCRSQ